MKFPFEEGAVIFTSFHNEAQNSRTELELLRYLVFTTVNAQLDASVERTMVRGGFSPVERNLLSASSTEQSLTETYECRGGKSLQFVLGFEDRGARLRLTRDATRRRRHGNEGRRLDLHHRGAARGGGQVAIHGHAGPGALSELPLQPDGGGEIMRQSLDRIFLAHIMHNVSHL